MGEGSRKIGTPKTIGGISCLAIEDQEIVALPSHNLQYSTNMEYDTKGTPRDRSGVGADTSPMLLIQVTRLTGYRDDSFTPR